MAFDSARAEFQEVVRSNPDHPAGYFFLGMVDWWVILIDIDNESHDEEFLATMDRVIAICDKRLDKDENDLAGLFFKGGALGFQGRLHANREDWVKAASAGHSALDLVIKAYKIAPNNYDVLFGMGIYDYYAAVIPEQYPFVKPLMLLFPKGDKDKGIEQLRQAVQHASYANREAAYFLIQIFINYEKRYGEALPLAAELHNQFPDNPVYHRYVGRSYAAVNDWTDTRTTYAEILACANRHKFGYGVSDEREAHYYLGLMDMNEEKFDPALQHFYKCDELSRTLDKSGPSGFMAMTNLKIGMVYDLQSKRDLAIAQYNKVLKMPDYQGSQKLAERFLARAYGK
jgi:hypothetical protein